MPRVLDALQVSDIGGSPDLADVNRAHGFGVEPEDHVGIDLGIASGARLQPVLPVQQGAICPEADRLTVVLPPAFGDVEPDLQPVHF